MFVLNRDTVLPIKIWAEPEDLIGGDEAIAQAMNLANHPIIWRSVNLMPDFHPGYGMPIGGVIATVGGVIPNAIGVDIGCGMIAMKTDIEASSLSRESLEQIRLDIHAVVPVGFKTHKKPVESVYEVRALNSAANNPNPIVNTLLDQANVQLGTMGGGNHFLELQADAEDNLWVMVHSGSRGLGKKVCDYYHEQAKKLMDIFHSPLPEKNGKRVTDLAWIPDGIPLYKYYLEEMNWCMDFALASRRYMLRQAIIILKQHVDTFSVDDIIETHHNFAAMENHFGKNVLVHRKGAVRARGGEKLTIPGSMGTASFIAVGKGESESFASAPHGAGRVYGRGQANRTITHEQAVESMKHVVFGIREGQYDEMPAAYKDVYRVMQNAGELCEPIVELKPLTVVKG